MHTVRPILQLLKSSGYFGCHVPVAHVVLRITLKATPLEHVDNPGFWPTKVVRGAVALPIPLCRPGLVSLKPALPQMHKRIHPLGAVLIALLLHVHVADVCSGQTGPARCKLVFREKTTTALEVPGRSLS